MSRDTNERVERQARLAGYVAYVVVAVWATLALASVVTQDYEPLTLVTPVTMIVVGFLFGFRNGIKKKDNG